MYGDLKLSFIEVRLREYLEDVRKDMIIQMGRDDVGITEELEKSITGKVSGESFKTAELIFKEYGRFVDMGVGSGHPLGGVKQTRKVLGRKKQPGRKRKNIYSRIAYGKLNYLENQLLYGFTEEARQQLLNQFPNGTGTRQ